MKLGISYLAFHGEELLEYVLRPIRHLLDFVGVVYQDKSFKGNHARPELLQTLRRLQELGLVDRLAVYQPDGALSYKENEAAARNLGLDEAIGAGCTHHITADMDEFYLPEQLAFAKSQMGGYDCSMAGMQVYFKEPTWRLTPTPKQIVPLIHEVGLRYDVRGKFPVGIDDSRRMTTMRCRRFAPEEVTIHHMSYVRKDMREKLENTSHRYDVQKFLAEFDKYCLGDRIQLAPDRINRRTVLVENVFHIPSFT